MEEPGQSIYDEAQRQAAAAADLKRQESRADAEEVVAVLSRGLNTVRDSFLDRAYHDVERILGVDSVLTPLSSLKSELATQFEIELFQVAEADQEAAAGEYFQADPAWRLDWLSRLRLGDDTGKSQATDRLASYAAANAEQRRLAFSNHLVSVMPEATRAPLVVFQLLPLAIHIAVASAFGNPLRAQQFRLEQTVLLPAIRDCQSCRGKVLEDNAKCDTCGNPLWEYKWLQAAD